MANLNPLREKIRLEARRRVDQATRKMASDLERTAPRVTGRLANSISVEVQSQTAQRITSVALVDVPYAEPVILGARFHKIFPKRRGGVLVFPVDGKTVFARSVNHPGNDPNPFFERVTSRWREYLNAV